MFDLKVRKLANVIRSESMGDDSLQVLRLMGWLSESLADVLTPTQQERLQEAITLAFEEGTRHVESIQRYAA